MELYLCEFLPNGNSNALGRSHNTILNFVALEASTYFSFLASIAIPSLISIWINSTGIPPDAVSRCGSWIW